MIKTLTKKIVHIQNYLDIVFANVVKLEKKLEIATEALEEIPDLLGNNDDYGALCCATDALQEMEDVK